MRDATLVVLNMQADTSASYAGF